MKKKKKLSQESTCSFCGTLQSEVALLIVTDDEGPSICDHCVGVTVLLVEEFHRKREKEETCH